MNILKSMETTLDRANQYHWMLYYLLVAFFIFLAARWFHIDSSYVNAITPPKKIGLYSSVNWVITFIILFPFFVFLACSTASNNLALWHDLAGNRIVTGPEGIRTTSDSLLSTWAERLKTSNIVVIAFVAISAITAMTDYWDSAGGPLLSCSFHYTDSISPFFSPIDWATAPILNKDCANNRIYLLTASYMLYFLLIISLGFYLVFLYYLTSIFVFLQSTSKRRPAGYRLVYRPATLKLALSTLVESTMATVILGLAVCALMQAHAAYLQTADSSIVSFLTHDIGRIAKALKIDALTGLELAAAPNSSTGASQFLEYQRQTAGKVMTVLPLAATILLSAAVSAYALFDAVGNSMAYCREKASDANWLVEVGLTDEERQSIHSDTRIGAVLAIVTPYGPGYILGAFLLIISIITANFFVFLISVAVIVAYRIIIKAILKT